MLKLTSKANIEYIKIHYLYSFWSIHYVLLGCDVLNFCLGFSENLYDGSQMCSPVPSSPALFQFSYHFFFVSDEALTLIICHWNKKRKQNKTFKTQQPFFFPDKTSFLGDTSDVISRKSLQRKWVSSLKHYIMLS